VNNSCFSSALVPYIDSEFEYLMFDPDDMDAHVPEKDPLEPTEPLDFDATNAFELVNCRRQASGSKSIY